MARPRGTGRIFKRENTPYWQIAYWDPITKKEHRESARSLHKQDAIDLLDERRAQLRLGGSRMRDLKVERLLNDYVSDAYERNFRNAKRNERMAERIAKYIGHLKVLDIEAPVVKDLQERLSEEGLSGPSINRYIAVLHRSFTLAAENGFINRVPPFPRPRKESTPRQGFLSHDAFVAIQSELPPWAGDVFEFAYYSGWRSGEIRKLLWDQVDWRGKVVRLQSTDTKNREARVRPIYEDIKPVLLRRLRDKRPFFPYVFHRAGNRISESHWSNTWRPAAKRAGYGGVILHDCRRTAVRNLIRAGVPERVAMKMTGHRSRVVFDRYNIVDERDLEDAAKKLKSYIDQQRKKIVPFDSQ